MLYGTDDDRDHDRHDVGDGDGVDDENGDSGEDVHVLECGV